MRQHHPDNHELDDWPQYGPKNPAIADLVRQLAYDRGMRVAEIERIIERALRDELAEGQGGVTADASDQNSPR